jgi:hypothetical protein
MNVAYDFCCILTKHSTINMTRSGNVIINSFPLFDLGLEEVWEGVGILNENGGADDDSIIAIVL